jgi:hypothetical protein
VQLRVGRKSLVVPFRDESVMRDDCPIPSVANTKEVATMMNWDYMTNGWMGGWTWVAMSLLLALVVLGVVAAIRR